MMTYEEAREYFERIGAGTQSGRAGAALLEELDKRDPVRIQGLINDRAIRDAEIDLLKNATTALQVSLAAVRGDLAEECNRRLRAVDLLARQCDESNRLANELALARAQERGDQGALLAKFRAEVSAIPAPLVARRWKRKLLEALDSLRG